MDAPLGELAQVGIDVADLDRSAEFWKAVLGVEEKGRHGPYLNFKPLKGGVPLYLQKVPEKKTAKTRVHLDIRVKDMEEAASRIVKLGGKRVKKFEKWIVMLDPDDNEFCVEQG